MVVSEAVVALLTAGMRPALWLVLTQHICTAYRAKCCILDTLHGDRQPHPAFSYLTGAYSLSTLLTWSYKTSAMNLGTGKKRAVNNGAGRFSLLAIRSIASDLM